MGHTKRAILCPNCGKLISADTKECIHCGMKNPGKFGVITALQKFFRDNIGFMQIVTYFCAGLYAVSLLIDLAGMFQMRDPLSFLGPSGNSVLILGATGTYPLQLGRWWTLITAIYLHGSILHIIFNLLWIRQIGPMVEDLFGTSRLIIIFTVSGILGFILSTMQGTPLTIGASGSIFGLLGALIYYGRARGGMFRAVIYPQIMTWAVVLFIYGFLAPRVDNFAHLGGFIGGYLAANLFGYEERKPENLTHKTLAALSIVLTIVAFGINFAVLLL